MRDEDRDIVLRLRRDCGAWADQGFHFGALGLEAADEIERLRALVPSLPLVTEAQGYLSTAFPGPPTCDTCGQPVGTQHEADCWYVKKGRHG